jgi:hypothetical protein
MAESLRCSAFCLKAFRREAEYNPPQPGGTVCDRRRKEGQDGSTVTPWDQKECPKRKDQLPCFQILNTTGAVEGTLSRLTPHLVIDEAGGGIVG